MNQFQCFYSRPDQNVSKKIEYVNDFISITVTET